MALGFIAVVLFGNLWAGYALINAKAPPWVSYGFGAGLVVVIVAGLALGALAIYWWFKPPVEVQTIDEQ